MKIAITGTGMISSIGDTSEACFKALCEKISGVKSLSLFDKNLYKTKHAYEIKSFSEGDNVQNRASQWLLKVINDAMHEANLLERKKRIVVVIGTGLGETRPIELWWNKENNDYFSLQNYHNGNRIRKDIKCEIPVFTFSNACSASGFAMGIGEDFLNNNQADAVIVAGYDTISESMFALSEKISLQPPEKIEPFESNRRGVLLGEGAAAVVIEPVLENDSDDFNIQAYLEGVYLNCDAYNETAPNVNTIFEAMHGAHKKSGLKSEDIDVVFAHGTGTLLNDPVEATAMGRLFDKKIRNVYITGIKCMTGHTSGASALMSVIIGTKVFKYSKIPPILGLKKPIPEAENFNFVTNTIHDADPKIFQVNAFGFGGVNSVIIIKK